MSPSVMILLPLSVAALAAACGGDQRTELEKIGGDGGAAFGGMPALGAAGGVSASDDESTSAGEGSFRADVSGGQGGEGGAPMPAQPEIRVRVAVPLAPRFRIRIDGGVTLGREVTSVITTGPFVLAEVEDGDAVVDALRGATGSSEVVLADATGTRVAVDITFASRPWAMVQGKPFEALIGSAKAWGAQAAGHSEAWSIVGDDAYGTLATVSGARAFRMNENVLEVLSLGPRVTEAHLHHHAEGSFWGAVRRDGWLEPARFDGSLQAHSAAFPVEAAYFDARGGTRVGVAWLDGVARALRCEDDTYEACEIVEPPQAETSSARAIDAGGRVFGCAEQDGVPRPFMHTQGATAEWLASPERGCISGISSDGSALGEAEVGGELFGFIRPPRADAELVRVSQSWGTRLHGAGGGALVAAVQDESGVFRAARLSPITAPTGLSYMVAPEPADPRLSHACGHTVGGPFAAIAASHEPSLSGIIERTHTNFSVALSDESTQLVRLSNPRVGKISLHLSALFGLTLREPRGQVVTAAYADDTGRCEALRGFVQYLLEEEGTYTLQIEAAPRSAVNIVYERTWVIDPEG